MHHPFQCLIGITKENETYLLAACGPKVLSVSILKGAVVSQWTADVVSSNSTEKPEHGDGQEDRPAKKQKTSSGPVGPNVIKLVTSPDQQYAVAVTDDKAVRVFEIQADASLVEHSQRIMPKRPCAIEVLPDNATILCGDKFGDVYSLPILQSAVENVTETAPSNMEEPSVVVETQFKPSATTLTVHTGRNRLALESQMKQKNLKAKTKQPLQFEHKLLLGHVSMLTDHAFATREVEGKQRGYIITADRDEHIRISRGPPQAHIIEGYCLGHTEFVSKICLIPGTDLLVSGGGDDWLGVWEWPSFKLRRKLDLRTAVSEAAELEDTRVNVSGMWAAPSANIDDGLSETVLVVASEKVPALFAIPTKALLDEDSTFTTINLPKSPLDVALIEDELVVSLDSRDEAEAQLHAYRLTDDVSNMQTKVLASRDEDLEAKLQSLAAASASANVEDKTLNDLLYAIANLRKRDGLNATEGAEDPSAE